MVERGEGPLGAHGSLGAEPGKEHTLSDAWPATADKDRLPCMEQHRLCAANFQQGGTVHELRDDTIHCWLRKDSLISSEL